MRSVLNRFSLLLLTLLLAISGRAFGQGDTTGSAGFGNFITAKSVSLDRKLPPVYNMAGKTVRVRAVSQAPDAANMAIELQSAIENLLTGSDSTVHVRETSPDVSVDATITNYKRPAVVTDGTGTSKTTYVIGDVIVSFKIVLRSSSTLIASNVAMAEVDEPFSSGNSPLATIHLASSKKMTPVEAERTLLTEVSKNIASFLVITPETVRAKLAVGKALNHADEFAEKALWARDLEALSTMPPYGDPQMDSYRIYDLGVANEALAYQAQDVRSAIKYLQQASNDYGKAMDARPGEKNFLDPQNRIKVALSHYSADKAPPLAAAVEKKSAAGILTNDDVIEMFQAHMDEANIIDNIRSAPAVDFDLSINAQVKMSKDGVPGKVIMYMKEKQRQAPAKKAP
jgi:hypothetical protein